MGLNALILATPGLLDYWPLTDAVGSSTAVDSQGSLTLSVSGTVTFGGAGVNGTSAAFAGAGKLQTAGVPTGLPTGSATWTVGAWFRATTATSGVLTYYPLLSYGTATSNEYLGIYTRQDGVSLAVVQGPVFLTWTRPTSYLDGIWHQVVGTWDGTTRRLYFDGELVASDTPATPNVQYGGNTLAAGQDNFGDNLFTGSIASLAVYNRALTGSEVLAQYRAVYPPPSTVLDSRQSRQIRPEAPVRVNPAHPQARGLKLQYLFREGAGTAVWDTVQGLKGTITPDGQGNMPAWVTDPARQARMLDWGTTSTIGQFRRVNVSNSSIYKPTAALSVLCWIYPTAMVNYDTICGIDYRNNGTWSSPNWAYVLSCGNGTTFAPYFAVTTSGTITGVGPGYLPLNRWYHVCGTYDGANIKFYLNAGTPAVTAKTGAIDYGNNGPLAIGNMSTLGSPGSASQGYHGRIWDFRVYDRALSQAEINQVVFKPLDHLSTKITPFSIPPPSTATLTAVSFSSVISYFIQNTPPPNTPTLSPESVAAVVSDNVQNTPPPLIITLTSTADASIASDNVQNTSPPNAATLDSAGTPAVISFSTSNVPPANPVTLAGAASAASVLTAVAIIIPAASLTLEPIATRSAVAYGAQNDLSDGTITLTASGDPADVTFAIGYTPPDNRVFFLPAGQSASVAYAVVLTSPDVFVTLAAAAVGSSGGLGDGGGSDVLLVLPGMIRLA